MQDALEAHGAGDPSRECPHLGSDAKASEPGSPPTQPRLSRTPPPHRPSHATVSHTGSFNMHAVMQQQLNDILSWLDVHTPHRPFKQELLQSVAQDPFLTCDMQPVQCQHTCTCMLLPCLTYLQSKISCLHPLLIWLWQWLPLSP